MTRHLHRRSIWLLLLVAAVSIAVSAAASGRGGAAPTGCKPFGRLVGHTVVFCGPATASLSAFSGAVFENGTCGTTRVAGVQQFALRLGARTQSERTNDGRPYFGLALSGPFSHPSGGGVIAYWKGKRWGGVGVDFKGDARAGSFVASGINGSHGHSAGSYRC